MNIYQAIGVGVILSTEASGKAVIALEHISMALPLTRAAFHLA